MRLFTELTESEKYDLLLEFKKLQKQSTRLSSAQLLKYRFDLQLFAAEDEGRTEKPTETRKRKAREEGNVPKSQELVAIIVFIFTFATIFILGKTIFQTFVSVMHYYLDNITTIQINRDNILPVYLDMLSMIARVLLPLMLVGIISAVVANIAQSGWVFSTKKITPNFGKLIQNIPSNLKKMFLSGETAFNLVKSLFKVITVFFIAFLLINANFGKILTISRLSAYQGIQIIIDLILQFVFITSIVLLILALIDFAFQRWQYIESLKMKKEEIKQEMKEMEGDPEIKQKIREAERRILSRKQINEVPNADVVITNPTHFAIAIKYDPSFMNAPLVVAKGQDRFAQRIKEVARENDVYVIENRPLARALYKQVEVGEEIPADLFEAVANVLALVYGMKSPTSVAS